MPHRTWFLTWTTYGTWLPGDGRGFVGRVPDAAGRVIHNEFRTEYDRDIPWLRTYSQQIQTHEAVWLSAGQAEVAAAQFRQTSAFKLWPVLALAVMPNHVHLVVQADAGPDALLRTFKSYASRELNRAYGERKWWTTSGSKRLKSDEPAVRAAVRYVRDQPHALVIEVDADWLPIE